MIIIIQTIKINHHYYPNHQNQYYTNQSKSIKKIAVFWLVLIWPYSWNIGLRLGGGHHQAKPQFHLNTSFFIAVTNNLQVQDVYSIRGLQPATSYDLKV